MANHSTRTGRVEGIIRSIIALVSRQNNVLPMLLTLSPEDLRKVQCVMYAGIGCDDVLALSRMRQVDDHRVIACRIASKRFLAEDLDDGLAIARRDGVDLDAVWPVVE